MKKFVLAPDSFKESMTAKEVCVAINLFTNKNSLTHGVRSFSLFYDKITFIEQ